MENKNVEVKMGKTKEKGFKAWVKRHKVGIIGGVAAVSGLCLLQLTHNKGVDEGRQEGFDESVTDMFSDNVEGITTTEF